MNLVKINSKLRKYIFKVKNIKIPDVYELYEKLGEDVMGRKFYINPSKNKSYFNKSKIHKKYPSYIGNPLKEFYAQEIIGFCEEKRFLCVNGNASELQRIADIIINKFKIRDFVFDVFCKNGTSLNNCDKIYLMELNEIHLSSLEPRELEFIYTQIF